ncbi:16166_t:CDS:2 [Gigaspora margarita]|uniref:16166_t:CDS:1 n=1 Tax=Gigaspora margarita TaxID=4874 RepID=A0ABN7VYI4_GIGMA|nr:16166_t:CDS:2 [Gigaspora margarita]
MYAIGFARIKSNIDFQKLRKEIEKVREDNTTVLPDKLGELSNNMRSKLPFELPLSDRRDNIFDSQNEPPTHQTDHKSGDISEDRSTIDDDEQMQY